MEAATEDVHNQWRLARVSVEEVLRYAGVTGRDRAVLKELERFLQPIMMKSRRGMVESSVHVTSLDGRKLRRQVQPAIDVLGRLLRVALPGPMAEGKGTAVGQVGTTVNGKVAPVRRGGAPGISKAEEKRRRDILRDWDRAKGTVSRKDFCKDRGIQVKQLDNYINWRTVRTKRRSRSL